MRDRMKVDSQCLLLGCDWGAILQDFFHIFEQACLFVYRIVEQERVLIVLTYFFLILKSAGLHSDKKCTSVPTFFTEDKTKQSIDLIEESMYHTFVYKKLRIWVSTGSFLKSSDLCSPPEHFKTRYFGAFSVFGSYSCTFRAI